MPVATRATPLTSRPQTPTVEATVQEVGRAGHGARELVNFESLAPLAIHRQLRGVGADMPPYGVHSMIQRACFSTNSKMAMCLSVS